ncbi:hypothetical protein K458DRAFT_424369 [Lentithecium fluviatile CBS 122367]|uniref:Uncharacterized protein n=1 Tax=Lentithecium fluviatile CBS 122367 TaxID=1168545 RepID=A0A6G1IF78_9PLEO|nr:hypothetical protein K458DRAFT_424369 [Lentithecium fluviatile CBS 122367]
MGILTLLLGPPLLFFVSVPLLIFAAFTTAIAVSLLVVRVSVVYFELGVALLSAYLFPEPPSPVPKRPPPPPSRSPPRSRHRRGSSSSQDTAVPAARIHTKSGSSASLSLLSGSEFPRDFEGVGGWRFYEGEEDEHAWLNINKRLELPLPTPRRHRRRHTGEDRHSWSPEALRMSPVQSRVQSRARTPTSAGGLERQNSDYFNTQLGIWPLSTATEPLSKSPHHSRRASLSISGSSTELGPITSGKQAVE